MTPILFFLLRSFFTTEQEDQEEQNKTLYQDPINHPLPQTH
jgi:hypothetical protein